MERISVPFVAGIAASALLSGIDGSHSYSIGIAISALLSAFIFQVFLPRKGPQHGIGYSLTFFIAGLFCHASAMLTGSLADGAHSFITDLAGSACDRLKSSIDRLDLGDSVRNSLIKALLTGDRRDLPDTVSASFRAAGASHILALSGLHIGIIYAILARVLVFMGNSVRAVRMRSVILVLAAAFYTVMTGAGPSIVRAFLFIFLSEVCRNQPGRVHSPSRIFQTALVIQLAFNPAAISSLGFQLSYLAVLGIVLIMPALSGWFPGDGPFDPMKKIWDLCALSISCQCLTAPLIWIRFRTFPRFFLLTNLVAMPLTTMSIASAVFCLATGNHCPEIAMKFCGQCVSVLISFLEILASL